MSLTQRLFTDAFHDMQRVMAALDQPLYNSARRSLPRSTASNGAGGLFRYPATDMVETPESYELNAELPGYDKNNIKIELADSQTLVLSGSVDEQKEIKPPTTNAEADAEAEATAESTSAKEDPGENSPQWWVKERVSGSFSRSFVFPTPINSENIKASFDNGVLKVVVPKTTQTQTKQISIE
ncbi:HSP20-like chaperone [Parasitella parasitica]|nr:HSP20-like chaperone [Parasitella parasitica]